MLLQTFSSVANFPNDDFHWQGELPGSQSALQAVFQDHDVAFLCGVGVQAQVTVFKYSDGPLIPPGVRQVYLTNNTRLVAAGLARHQARKQRVAGHRDAPGRRRLRRSAAARGPS